jgi:hypothetical protein
LKMKLYTTMGIPTFQQLAFPMCWVRS